MIKVLVRVELEPSGLIESGTGLALNALTAF